MSRRIRTRGPGQSPLLRSRQIGGELNVTFSRVDARDFAPEAGNAHQPTRRFIRSAGECWRSQVCTRKTVRL